MTKTMNQYKTICLIYNIAIDGDKVPKCQNQKRDKYEISEAEIEYKQNELAMIMHDRYVEFQ